MRFFQCFLEFLKNDQIKISGHPVYFMKSRRHTSDVKYDLCDFTTYLRLVRDYHLFAIWLLIIKSHLIANQQKKISLLKKFTNHFYKIRGNYPL